METLVLLHGTGHVTKHQEKFIRPIKKWLENVCRRSLTEPEPRNTYFTYSFSALTNFVQNCIDQSRPDEKFFMSDVQSSFTRDKFRNYAIPVEIQQACRAIVESCRRHFLISLDAFDRAFDLFRKASDSRRSISDAKD